MLKVLIFGLFFTLTIGGLIKEKDEDTIQKEAVQKLQERSLLSTHYGTNWPTRNFSDTTTRYITDWITRHFTDWTTRYPTTRQKYTEWQRTEAMTDNYCSEYFCNYRGSCRDNQCYCYHGYTGKNCERVDWCASNPCMNGGYCSQGDYGYNCSCSYGYTGTHCEEESYCYSNPCLNGGTCHLDWNGFNCTCSPRNTGRYCERENYCVSSPCLNGGFCQSGRYDFNCTCQPGYTGRYCEQGRNKSSSCEKNPCLNGGTCLPLGNSSEFICKCNPQYVGALCEKTVDSKAPVLLVQMEKVSSSNTEKINILSAGGNIVFNGTGFNNSTGVSPFSNFFAKIKKMLGLDSIF